MGYERELLDTELGREALVAGLLELGRELGPAARHDATGHEHVHAVGAQLLEQARVVRDREHAEVVFGGHRLDAAGDVAQGVDVEAAVDLVEHRELRLEHRELQGLGALLLATGELDVDAAFEELLRDAESLGFGDDARVEIARLALLAADRGLEEVAEPHTGHLARGTATRGTARARRARAWGGRAARRRRW